MNRLTGRAQSPGISVRIPLALVAGGALALSQPPVSFPWIVFLSLPVCLWLVASARRVAGAAGYGWLAGAGYFTATLFWIVEPFQVDPELHGWLAPFALVGMGGGLALFWAAAFALARALPFGGTRRALAFAALLAAVEMARSHVFTGFPWGLLGYAWVETPVIQLASLVGASGLSLLTLIAALLPAAGLPRIGRPGAALLVVLLVGCAWFWGSMREASPVPARSEDYIVRIVQPNAPQHLKWQPEMQALFYERHLRMTAAEGERGRPDVVVWSETAVPFVHGFADDYEREIARAADGAPVILGMMRADVGPEAEHWYNSLVILGPEGEADAVYDKHHLVPFGEYIPFRDLIRRLGGPTIETLTRGGFTAGEGPALVGAPGVPPLLPLVCYEAIFARHLRAPEGRPDWIVQVTNDAWFGTLAGPYQHYAQNRVRAIEQGLPMVRAANTGISAVIDPYGREMARLDLGEEGFIDAPLPAAIAPTLFARYGERPEIFVIVSMLALTFVRFSGGHRRLARS